MVGRKVEWWLITVSVRTCAILDIDECADGNGGCDQICTNNNGSFMCSCGTGYILTADNLGCDGKYFKLLTS